MSRSRILGLSALSLFAAAATAEPGYAEPRSSVAALQDVQAEFDAAIDLWERGRKEESLDKMRAILAGDPEPTAVYEAYLSADRDVITSFMAEGDEYTAVARRFLERASSGRDAIEKDEGSIKELSSSYMQNEDPVERLQLISEIRQRHGEYGAPPFVNVLANQDEPEKVTRATLALRGLREDAVLPLIAALDSDDAFQRRNAALTLGYIGDPRAAAHLAAIATTDENETARAAAADAAMRVGATGDPLPMLLQLGDDFHHRRSRVTYGRSGGEVVWTMNGRSLDSLAVPSSIHNDELAKDAYYRALEIAPDSIDAKAGIARANVDIQAKLDLLESAGQDVSGLVDASNRAMLAVYSAGPDALDRALQMSVESGDAATGPRIARVLGDLASEPTPGLEAALAAGGASMAGEAAVALAKIAVRAQSAAGSEVVNELSRAAGRRVMKVVVVIDGDAQRASTIMDALEGENVLGQHAGSGAQGIVMVGQLPGIDAILVGDDLDDITTDAVISKIRENPAFEETPIYLLTAKDELASAYGDRIQGSFAGADGIGALQDVFDAELDDNRARADELSGAAADALAALARSGRTDVSSGVSGLMQAIDGRRDGVAIPALRALGQVGGQDAVEGILAVLTGDEASEGVRVAAADALGAMGSRMSLPAETASAVRDVLAGDAPLVVRSAAARALGRMNVDTEIRRSVLEATRVRVGQ